MKGDRTRLIIVFVFALTLGAGIAAGLLASRLPLIHPKAKAQAQPNGTSWLVQQLDLSPAQSEQMRQIWEGVKEKTDQSIRDAASARDKRDADIQKLVPNEKLEEYRAANVAYDSTVARLKAQREETFDRAVKRTKEILSPAQQEKYNDILKDRLEPGGTSHQDSADRTGPVNSTASPS
jgi:Spy/CpxP family protein refolding chaperone